MHFASIFGLNAHKVELVKILLSMGEYKELGIHPSRFRPASPMKFAESKLVVLCEFAESFYPVISQPGLTEDSRCGYSSSFSMGTHDFSWPPIR